MEIILKNLLIVALLAVVLPSVAVAGNNKSSDAEQRVEQLTKKLALSSEQQEKVRAILMDAQAKNEALAKKYKLDAYEAEAREINDASKKAISEMLMPEQRQKFETMKKSKKQKKK